LWQFCSLVLSEVSAWLTRQAAADQVGTAALTADASSTAPLSLSHLLSSSPLRSLLLPLPSWLRPFVAAAPMALSGVMEPAVQSETAGAMADRFSDGPFRQSILRSNDCFSAYGDGCPPPIPQHALFGLALRLSAFAGAGSWW